MSPSDLTELQKAAARWIEANGETVLLVLADKFEGWDRGDWDDSSIQTQLDRHIRRIAVVCDPKWADQVLMFMGQGLRRVAIQQFPPADVAKAKSWLTSKS
jgi:hypothetical protein